MNNKEKFHKILTYFIAVVWAANGLLCKLFNLVPRHHLIVSRILGSEYAGILTKAIGVSEVLMAIWVLSAVNSRFCAIAQIIIVATMNIIEIFLAPDLLLFGKINLIIAMFFIAIIYYNEFAINKKLAQQT